MPQGSYAYAVARIRALETHMLDALKFARLKEVDEDEALKLLQEAGYGQCAVNEDIEPAISAELNAARKAVWEVTPEPELTGLFLLPIDAHNLKALLKARLMQTTASDILLEGGLFNVEKLIKAVSEKDYRDLPDAFSQALTSMERQIQNNPDPRYLSAVVDRTVFAYIRAVTAKKKNAFVSAYFAAQADFVNVRSVIRARALHYETDKLASMLVPGGEISSADLIEALSLPVEQLSKKLGKGKNGRAIGAALDEYATCGSSTSLERRMDAALMALTRSGKHETFGLGPVIGYLLGREAEARALRVLFAAKRAKRDVELPELYA